MIAIIPARGGSKGLPGKNIKELCGKPLIGYTIEAALKAEYINNVIVTTDSMEIAKTAEHYGARVPFLRPEYLAEDASSAIDVYLHAVEYIGEQENTDIKKFVVLLPTAPMRDNEDIDSAIALFYKKQAETLISVTEAEIPPSWYYTCNELGRIQTAGFDVKNSVSNRQMNDKYYIPNGAIYILDSMLLKEHRTYYSDNTIPYIMPAEKSIDIDTILDFQFAEYLMKQKYTS